MRLEWQIVTQVEKSFQGAGAWLRLWLLRRWVFIAEDPSEQATNDAEILAGSSFGSRGRQRKRFYRSSREAGAQAKEIAKAAGDGHRVFSWLGQSLRVLRLSCQLRGCWF